MEKRIIRARPLQVPFVRGPPENDTYCKRWKTRIGCMSSSHINKEKLKIDKESKIKHVFYYSQVFSALYQGIPIFL